MTLVRWVVIAVVLACFVAVFLIVRSYRRDMDDMQADRDEDAAALADLRADVTELSLIVQQQRTRLTQLAQHVTASEQPSTGRHAHSGRKAA